jgi:hypothetical protein
MTDPSTAPLVPLHEVEWRIDGEPFDGKDGWRARYVPYLDARWCARALDEWVGPAKWQRRNVPLTFRGTEIVECFIAIDFGDGWIEKSDVGLIEGGGQTGIKGTFSDAFKRAASVSWGVGRNVYDLPKDIWAEVTVRFEKDGSPKKNRNGKVMCREAPGSRLQIRAELEKRGHEILAVGKDVKIGDGSSDHDATPDAAEPLTAEQVAEIGALFSPLAGETLKAAKARLFRSWGKIADAPAERFDDIMTEAREIVAEHHPLEGSPANGTPEAPDSPEEPSKAAQSPTGDAPPVGPAYTADEVEKFTAKTLAEELTRYGLPLTGKMDEKRARLLEAMTRSGGKPSMADWIAGDEFTHHPDTGEQLFAVPKYIEGIERYEEDLDDEQSEAWNAWMSEHLADAAWPNLTQAQAFKAYETIHHLSTKGALPDA